MRKRIGIIGIILFSVLMIIGGIMYYRQYKDKKQSKAGFEKLETLVKEKDEVEDEVELEEPTAMDRYKELLALNEDFVGWIQIEGTGVSYPVMQTKDRPDFYLKKNFEKQYSNYGVPYVQANVDLDVSDNTVIYGHHMQDGTMFSDLTNYTSKSFYKGHKYIQFDTLSGYGKYEIISVFKTTAYLSKGFRYYLFVNTTEEQEFDDYIATCKELAFYDTGVTAEYGDKLITLSTCEYTLHNGRLVVVAKKVADE
ncbi:sortase B [Lachnospiraceae bacterium PM6-15]|uniref:class B sortase n=1 Tax=Ohessyouella blattaphilus TaxID=2949333 RepID=UPI003E18D07C